MEALERRLARFRSDESGSQTIESVIWLPVFSMFLVLIIDVSMVFNKQSELLRIVQDANRAYSTGRLASAAEAESFVQAAVANYTSNPSVTTTLVNGVITTRLVVPATDLMPINSFPVFKDKDVVIATQHLAEF
ncbi:TadE/TadG family type IV pilus assembly protein [Aestuariicoccus sp. MJ-SS9]|uniref:TadE/TadG family type IV pilus assembly protein n=1 Tax=Aestuariicoccus sp. MJ-SS9 TaxID=3079855 RepID=UPI002908344C|nr:TadE/TadG family type IV pilus assembly protein [Aestuariicoccus sp. MJ-SS9]MDU8911226.1 TadE/TadG family type IV pilus assembly protein [Aestuariicoccus sp. MJ-SS9]